MRVLLLLCGCLWAGQILAADAPPAAPAEPVVVPLSNPGFETELQGWEKPGAAAEPMALVDREVKHGGAASLKLTAKLPGQRPTISQKVTGLQPGAVYTLTAWRRGQPGPPGEVALRLEFRTAAGLRAGGDQARGPAGEQWQALNVTARAEPGASQAIISLRLLGGMQAWADDFQLEMVRPAPPLLAQPARLATAADQKQTVRLSAQGEGLAPGPAKLEVLSATKTVATVDVALVTAAEGGVTAEVELPPLPNGAYLLRVKAPAGTLHWPLFVSPAKRRPPSLTDRGALLRDGRAFFPLGLYHVAVADYVALSQRGFNAAQGPAATDDRQLKTAFAQAKAQRVALMMPLYAGHKVAENLPLTQRKVRAHRKQTPVLGWKLVDEPEAHPAIAEEVPEAYWLLHKLDPVNPVLLTVADPAAAGYWKHFCDVLEVSFVLRANQPLDEFAAQVAQVRGQLEPWQGLVVLLAAGWKPEPGNQPTLDQTRAAALVAILKGATGLFWYALRDPGWFLGQTPLWDKFGELNEELAQVGKLSLGAPAEKVEVTDGPLEVGAWSQDGKTVVAVVNTGQLPRTATLKFARPVEKVDNLKGQAQAEVKDGAVRLAVTPGGAVTFTALPVATPQ